MKNILRLSILSVLFISMNVTAAPAPAPKVELQTQSNVLRGKINDLLTEETLAGATITANGQKIYSDLDGNFSIPNICNGKCQIKINMISYKEQTLNVDINNGNNIQIKLEQR